MQSGFIFGGFGFAVGFVGTQNIASPRTSYNSMKPDSVNRQVDLSAFKKAAGIGRPLPSSIFCWH